MASVLTRVAGAALLAAGAFGFHSGSADAATLRCIQGSGGLGSAAIDLVNDGCIATKDDATHGVYAPPGGDSEEAVEQAIIMATNEAVNISLFGKKEDNGQSEGPYGSLIEITPITVGDDGGILTGEWRILRDDVQIKYITVKAGDSYALYELSGDGATSGTFTTAGLLNKNGKQQALSHLTLWISHDVTVPEPASLGILGAGLMGLGLMRRRTRR